MLLRRGVPINYDNYTIVISGLGGQGLISLLQILGNALITKGYKVITSETHGLSQRGGKVTCFLRFGNRMYAPIPILGSADMIIATEKSCILDVLKYSKPDKSSKLIISTQEKKSFGTDYPSEKYLSKSLNENSDDIYFVPAMKLAEKYMNIRIINTIILGYILRFLPLSQKELEVSINHHFREKSLEINLIAFNEGFKLK